MSLLSASYGSDTDDDHSDEDTATGGLVAYVDDDADPVEAEQAEAAPSSTVQNDEAKESGELMTEIEETNGAGLAAMAAPTKSLGDGPDGDSTERTQESVLPPRPKGEPPAVVLQRVKLMSEKRQSTNLNEFIRARPSFQNPSIYEKLIDMMEIDQLGTNCPPEMYNPRMWTEADYFDKLAEARAADAARRAAARQKRAEVQFVSATGRNPPQSSQGSTAGKVQRRRDPKVEAARQEVARRAAAMLSQKRPS